MSLVYVSINYTVIFGLYINPLYRAFLGIFIFMFYSDRTSAVETHLKQ